MHNRVPKFNFLFSKLSGTIHHSTLPKIPAHFFFFFVIYFSFEFFVSYFYIGKIEISKKKRYWKQSFVSSMVNYHGRTSRVLQVCIEPMNSVRIQTFEFIIFTVSRWRFVGSKTREVRSLSQVIVFAFRSSTAVTVIFKTTVICTPLLTECKFVTCITLSHTPE